MKKIMFGETPETSNAMSQGTNNNEVLCQSKAGRQERRGLICQDIMVGA